MKNFYDLEFSDLGKIIKDISQPSYRAMQIWKGVYQHFYPTWQSFTNLPKDLRSFLESNYSLSSLDLTDESRALDELSTKLLFKLNDGNFIESVILRSYDRVTLCVSTQSGCPVGCAFCATGNLGFFRNLTSGEIVEQVIYLQRMLRGKGESITNIVLMGMGEPFLNYTASLCAVKRLNNNTGMNIGARRITISTIGIPERIIQFAQENMQVNLAVSLHAPNDLLRVKLVPMAAKTPISEIIDACKEYIIATHRRVTFEYVLIAGINDQPVHASELSKLLQGMLCHINLIGLNPTDHYPGKSPDRNSMEDFCNILQKNKIPTSIRDSQGTDIQAACGQLAGRNLSKR